MAHKKVHMVGINDADYKIAENINGKQVLCPFYTKWKAILYRCYDPKVLLTHPSYKGCTMCDEWLTFSIFKAWMESQDWKGLSIDKDLLNPGNKVYSPDNCMFVTQEINSLLVDRGNDRGKYPQGVTFDKKRKTYRAKISCYGKVKSLGYFKTTYMASLAYKKAKSKHIAEVAEKHKSNTKLYDALMQYV